MVTEVDAVVDALTVAVAVAMDMDVDLAVISTLAMCVPTMEFKVVLLRSVPITLMITMVVATEPRIMVVVTEPRTTVVDMGLLPALLPYASKHTSKSSVPELRLPTVAFKDVVADVPPLVAVDVVVDTVVDRHALSVKPFMLKRPKLLMTPLLLPKKNPSSRNLLPRIITSKGETRNIGWMTSLEFLTMPMVTTMDTMAIMAITDHPRWDTRAMK
jgi:hypothetical protein